MANGDVSTMRDMSDASSRTDRKTSRNAASVPSAALTSSLYGAPGRALHRVDDRSLLSDARACARSGSTSSVASIEPGPDLDVFVFEGGARLGVYFVADDIALSDARQREGGTWIEIVVRDFQAPGGQVFRLAS